MSIAIVGLKLVESSAVFPYLITCIMRKKTLGLMFISHGNVSTV